MVEVADTTLAFDLGTRIPLYARDGVAEAWVVDVQERALHVFRDPSPSGYRTCFTVSGKGSVAPVRFPSIVVALPELVPA